MIVGKRCFQLASGKPKKCCNLPADTCANDCIELKIENGKMPISRKQPSKAVSQFILHDGSFLS